jgi:hypothetical protein
LIGERRHCVECNKQVDVVGEGLDNDVQVLSCGHRSKGGQRSIINPLSAVRSQPSVIKAISDAWDKIPPWKISKIEPLTTGTLPVQVSGEGLPKTQGVLDISTLSMNNQGDVFIVNPKINVKSTHMETHTDMSTTVINNLNDVLIEVDKSDMSQEERSKVKEILTIVDKENGTKSLREIFSSSLQHLKTWLPLAQPYITMYLGSFCK